MKICAYVQSAYAKTAYKNECMDVRQFVGLRIIINELEKAGYTVEYAGIDTVHQYDVVLVSITAFCDWWTFIKERLQWRKGAYRVLIGGAGCLNVRPFLRWIDVAMLGRGEDLIVPVVQAEEKKEKYLHESVLYSDDFSPDHDVMICQAREAYPDGIQLHKGTPWQEGQIGCNHRCFFCSYTWSRKQNFQGAFKWDAGGTLDMSERECALLDYLSKKYIVNWRVLRTTAIDGFSERIRRGVNKPIPNAAITQFLHDMAGSPEKPHIIKFFNIIGFPSETEDDWHELQEVFAKADTVPSSTGNPWTCVIQNTPFMPYPATPMACAPISKRNYRDAVCKAIAPGAIKHQLYAGKGVRLVESETVEALATTEMNAIVCRGTEAESENFARIASTPKFWSAPSATKEAYLEKYFPLDWLFSAFTPEELPNRYIKTYARVEKLWGRTELEKEERRMRNGNPH